MSLAFRAIHNKRSLVSLDNLVSFISHCIGHSKAAHEMLLISDGEGVFTSELLRKVVKAFGGMTCAPICEIIHFWGRGSKYSFSLLLSLVRSAVDSFNR